MSAKEEEAMKANLARIHETAQTQECLDAMDWAFEVPDTWFHKEEQEKLAAQVRAYVHDFDSALLKRCDTQDTCMSKNVWSCELRWALECLARRDLASVHLTNPRDRAIRAEATAHPLFQDPGNVVLDTMYHALRLWDFVREPAQSQVRRVATKEYGTGPNKSAAGPVNFRGNQIEALASRIQKLATFGVVGKGKPSTGRGAEAASSSAPPVILRPRA